MQITDCKCSVKIDFDRRSLAVPTGIYVAIVNCIIVDVRDDLMPFYRIA